MIIYIYMYITYYYIEGKRMVDKLHDRPTQMIISRVQYIIIVHRIRSLL